MKAGNARVAMLDIGRGERVRRHDFSTAIELSEHLKLSSTQSLSSKRIFIMEGLAPDFISVLGGHFLIEPTLFMAQERTTLWGSSHEGNKQTPRPPSLVDPGKAFTLKYYELLGFDNITSFDTWCATTGRNISTMRNTQPNVHNYEFEPIGIVHRKCSFWSRDDNGGWVAVILCDPHVGQTFVQDRRQHIHHSNIQNWTSIVFEQYGTMTPGGPFSGGYLDFIKHPEFGSNVPTGPPRISMLEDLCFYIIERGHHVNIKSSPAAATIFMKKIVASLYMQLLEAVRANVRSTEYQLSCKDDLSGIEVAWIEKRWSDLRSWSLRCSQYVEDVEAILINFRIPFSGSPVPQSATTDWTSCDEDFQYIHYYLKSLKDKVGEASNSITGLAGIAGNRQALQEAKRSLKEAKGIKTLTLLGMTFIPLAFCTGLFSMNDKYLPGTASFWVYFAVSIPLVISVFLVAFLISFGYDGEAEWSFRTFIQTLSNIKVSS